MPPKSSPELAKMAAIHRTLPKLHSEYESDTTSATEADALDAFGGQFVWLYASGGDITVLLGAVTVVAGEGIVLKDGEAPQEFFVDPSDTFDLSHVASASATLHILHD